MPSEQEVFRDCRNLVADLLQTKLHYNDHSAACRAILIIDRDTARDFRQVKFMDLAPGKVGIRFFDTLDETRQLEETTLDSSNIQTAQAFTVGYLAGIADHLRIGYDLRGGNSRSFNGIFFDSIADMVQVLNHTTKEQNKKIDLGISMGGSVTRQ